MSRPQLRGKIKPIIYASILNLNILRLQSDSGT